MKLSKIALALSGVVLGGMLLSGNAAAKGRLVIYCSAQNTMCEQEAMAFEKKYDVKTSFIRGGTGTILAKIDAEKDNPQGDVWYGGTMDPHSQAGEMGLLEPYKSPNLPQIVEQFRDPAKMKGNYSSAIYLGVLGFGVNPERLQKLNLPIPKCWKDLADPMYRNEIQAADPQSSGTGYTQLATYIQLWGEEKAFDYLKKLNENVSQYVKSNLVTANLSRGESAVSVGFVHAYATEKEKGAPVETVIPQGKTGYALGGASIIKGARNLDNAKLFMDFVLSKEVQEMPWRDFGLYQIPTNANAESSPKSVDPKKLDFVEFDFVKFGSKDEGKRLINKWLADIKLSK